MKFTVEISDEIVEASMINWVLANEHKAISVEEWLRRCISHDKHEIMKHVSVSIYSDEELEALAEKNQDKKEKIEAIIELVNEYRLSEDHTLARAHITLYKIDMDILSKELETSIYCADLRRDKNE